MSIEVSPYGQIQEFLQVLKRRRWQILLPAAFVLVFGSVFAVIVPKKYVIETEIELQENRIQADADFRNLANSPTDREIENVVNFIRHHARIEGLVRESQERHWPEYVKADRTGKFDIVEAIKENLEVSVREKRRNEGTTFITVAYKDTQAERGEEFLTGITTRALEDIFSRTTETLERERDQVAAEHAKVEQEADAANRQWKERAALAGQDPTRAPGDVGRGALAVTTPVFDEVTRLEGLLRDAVLEGGRLQVEVAELERRWAAEPATVERVEVEGRQEFSAQIAAVNEQIERMRLELGKLTPKYSGYGPLKERIQTAEAYRDELVAQQTEGEEVVISEPNELKEQLRQRWNDAESELQANLAQQELLRAEVAAASDRAKSWGEELATLQDLWERRETSARRFERVDEELEAKERALRQHADIDVGVLLRVATPAQASDRPNDPNPWLIVAFSLFAGLALGLGIAMLAEYARNSYRTVPDLARVMTVPVIGSISSIVTRRERRRARTLRLVVGTSSAVILLGVSVVTWIWANEETRHILPVPVIQAIDDFQLNLMGL